MSPACVVAKVIPPGTPPVIEMLDDVVKFVRLSRPAVPLAAWSMLMVKLLEVPLWPGSKSRRRGAVCSSAQPARFVVCHGQGEGETHGVAFCPCSVPLSCAAATYGPTKGPP